jgi:hypothetical protein
MIHPFEGLRPEKPSVDQINQMAELAVGLLHNLTIDATGEHAGSTGYQIDDNTLVAINVDEFRRTTAGRPDIVVTLVEFDPSNNDDYDQTEVTLWESCPPLRKGARSVPYEVIDFEFAICAGHEKVVVRKGLDNSMRRRIKKLPKEDRSIMSRLADPTFHMDDYLKITNALSACTEANRIDEGV